MSCQIIKERERKVETTYSLIFDIDGNGNGYAFPCDQDGNIFEDLNDAAKENYQWALEHPEKFVSKPYVEKRSWSYTTNAIAKCICGEEFELYDGYEGACACPKCGRWYNLFGQELLKPEYWEENEEGDDGYDY